MRLRAAAALAAGLLSLCQPGAPAGEAPEGQKQAVAAIEKIGGKVEYDPKDPARPVVRVRLNETRVTDKDLEHLRGLTALRRIDLHGTAVTDEGLRHLRGLTKLNRLYLTATKVSDKGLGHLTGLTELEFLDLDRTKVTAEGVEKLRQKLPNTKIYWDNR
jgi:hypothetical protein